MSIGRPPPSGGPPGPPPGGPASNVGAPELRGGGSASDQVTRLYFALMRLARVVRRADTGLRMPAARLSALATLAAHGPMRPGDLAAREQVSPPTLSRTLALLSEAGLVGRTTDPADQRATLLTVTPAGYDVLARVRAARTQLLLDRLEQLPDVDRARVLDAVTGLEQMARPPEQQG